MIKSLEQHLENDGRPKRILCLDGGGLRGIVSLGFLAEIEAQLKDRHGAGDAFRLNHYFDLIAGTSTGAIIAAALAQGMTVSMLFEKYMSLGKRVFERTLFRQGLFRAKYGSSKLIGELQEVFGSETLLGDPSVSTGLLIVTKRLDTGSPWPVSNNPRGRYYTDRSSGAVGNAKYPLWQVVRASTAAPHYFDPEPIEISERVSGEFVDGGVSPFNNPALQALMYATLDGYRLGWPKGSEKLLLVSVGTGLQDPAISPAKLAAENAVKSLASLMGDSAALMETMLQWMSSSPTARIIDRELGDLRHDSLADKALMTYLRYNVELSEGYLTRRLGMTMGDGEPESLCAMDDPDKLDRLKEVGEIGARQQVKNGDFPSHLDLTQ